MNYDSSPSIEKRAPESREIDTLPVDPDLVLSGIAEAEVAAGRISREDAVRAGVDFAREQTLDGLPRQDRVSVGAFYNKL